MSQVFTSSDRRTILQALGVPETSWMLVSNDTGRVVAVFGSERLAREADAALVDRRYSVTSFCFNLADIEAARDPELTPLFPGGRRPGAPRPRRGN